MADLLLPDIGENVAGGDVVRILVNEGDSITKDQAVLELETDKATIEVPSDQAGVVSAIKVKEGDKVKVGQVVLTLSEEGEKGKGQRAEGTPGERDKGEGDKGEEDKSEEDKDSGDKGDAADEPKADNVVDISSRKSSSSGTEKAEKADKGGKTEKTEKTSQPSAPAADSAASRPMASETAGDGSKAAAAPSVRRMARELGVDITRVSGSGPGGRIGAEDVQAHVKAAMTSRAGSGTGVATPALPDFSKWGEIERKPMSNIRRKTSEHLSAAWNTIPHVTQHDKADITSFEGLRKQYGARVEKAGGKLTITAVLLKIAAAAIRKYPQFASSADGDTIVYKKYVHIGVAVDTEHGLLVPVIRDVDQKTITDLSAELAQLSEKARNKKLGLDEMSGGVFTITNLGGIGGTSFTPIVNHPEVAILGVSRGTMEPVWDGEEFVAAMMMPLSLSYDHRVIDGADAARFLRFICEAVENPLTMSL